MMRFAFVFVLQTTESLLEEGFESLLPRYKG